MVYALFIVPDSELQVTRHYTLLLVIPGSVTSEFQDFGSEIFENSSKIDWKWHVNNCRD